MEVIDNRRSVRTYLDKPVDEKELELLLRAAMRAPSAGNEQPWEFIVMQDRDRLDAAAEVSPYAKPLLRAPMAIVVCGNLKHCVFPGKEQDYWIQDCSASIQNMLLEAAHLGLGGVWLGIYPADDRVERLSRLLDLPEDIIPLGIVSLGYPEEIPAPMETFLPERIHRERW